MQMDQKNKVDSLEKLNIINPLEPKKSLKNIQK